MNHIPLAIFVLAVVIVAVEYCFDLDSHVERLLDSLNLRHIDRMILRACNVWTFAAGFGLFLAILFGWASGAIQEAIR